MPCHQTEYRLQPPAAVSNGVGLANEYQLSPQPLHSALAWPLNVFFSVSILTELAINTATMWRQRKHYTQNVEIKVEQIIKHIRFD